MLKKLNGKTIALLGGSGFVGRALASCLVAAGAIVRVLTRDREHARALWSMPQTSCHALDVYDGKALARGSAGCDAMVNLVGILNERGDSGRGFQIAHVDLTRTALAACTDANVPRFVQMSALNAAPDAPSYYLRTKGQAEVLVATARGLRTAIVRPSVIFGAGDGLFHRFADLVRWLPCLPLAGADVRFQPVYVGDVAEALLRILAEEQVGDCARFDLGGPEIWTLREIVDYTARFTGHFCPVIPLAKGLARIQAEVCEHLPGKPFSRDNWRSLKVDSVVLAGNGLVTLGIVPTAIASVMPALLQSH